MTDTYTLAEIEALIPRHIKLIVESLLLLEGFLISVGLLDPERQAERDFDERVQIAYSLLSAQVSDIILIDRPQRLRHEYPFY